MSTLYDSEAIFKRLGVYVEWWYELEEMKGTLDTLLTRAIDVFGMKSSTPSEADKVAYESFSSQIHQQQSTLESLRYGVANLVSEFLGTDVKSILGSPYTAPGDVLTHLLDLMDDDGDLVKGNETHVVEVNGQRVFEDEDNTVTVAGDNLTLPTLVEPPTQLARADVFSLVCSDDSTVDKEIWTLNSGRLGQLSGQVVSGVPSDWVSAGLEDITVTPAPAHDKSGSDTAATAKVTAWNLTGAVRGTHVASDGTVWAKFSDAPEDPTVENDELGQLVEVDWSPTGQSVTFGEDTDEEGRMYVSIVKTPSYFEVLGGSLATLDTSDFAIDGNTSHSMLYATVTLGSGDTYTVELYTDSARTDKVAATSTPVTGSFPLLVPFEEYNSSGISGHVTLSAFDSETPDVDDTILIRIPRFVVQLHNAPYFSDESLRAEAVSFSSSTGAGFLDLGTLVSVRLKYIQDNTSIVLTPCFYTIDLYKANPSTGTDQDIVARAGSLSTNLLTGNAVSDLSFIPVNNSGLSEATIDISAGEVTDGEWASAVVGYTTGDKFSFSTSAGSDARFQTFLRETFNRVFPAAPYDHPENATIDDSLAGS